jgi:ATP-dependent Clp protease ATP-binding subunit ClpA
MMSPAAEAVLHRCFVSARSARRRFVTVEHMVLEMLREAPVVQHLKTCAVNVDAFRLDLEAAISKVDTYSAAEDEPDTQPTVEFQRVIQKAILDAQSSGQREVSLIDLLAAALKQKGSFVANRLLDETARTNTSADLLKVSARACDLCAKLQPVASLTVITGRGVLCAECIAAVQALKK